MTYVNIPDDILFLLNDKMKSKIEKQTEVSISIDDKAKTVSISHANSVREMEVKQILNALKLGFDINTAFKIFNNDFIIFETINIKDNTRNDKEFKRQKGRIIGQNGRTKELISELAEVDVSINDKSVGIIGNMQDVKEAKRAILKIIQGDRHATVYNQLEKYKSKK